MRGDSEATRANQTCIAASVNDVELEDVDHKYPHLMASADESELPVTAILYGLVGTPSFYSFHDKLVELAKTNELQYIVRPYAKDSDMETLLQGYGVALDIKNMEYNTIDDSKKSTEEGEVSPDDEDEGDSGELEEEEDDEDDDDDEEEEEQEETVADSSSDEEMTPSEDGSQEEPNADESAEEAATESTDEKTEEEKSGDLKNLGFFAMRKIVKSNNPLLRLQQLSQDFPLHGKKLASTARKISDELRKEIKDLRFQVGRAGLLNKFILNGIAVDPMQRSFNIFDFMATLKREWSVAKQLGVLPLADSEREEMLQDVRDAKQAQPAARIHIRGEMGGTTPLYLNNIETDPHSEKWNADVEKIKQSAWGLVFLRRNMYEYVLIFDPTTKGGRNALEQIAFIKNRGAPIQWGMLISSEELVAAKSDAERQALVEGWKAFEPAEANMTAWHFAKLLLLAQSKDKAISDAIHAEEEAAFAEVADSGSKSASETDSEAIAAEEKEEEATEVETFRESRVVQTAVAFAFIEGMAQDTSSEALTIQHLINAYVDATFSLGDASKNEEEALAVLRGDRFDDEVIAMTKYIHTKHLLFETCLFNGVMQKDIDLQQNIMTHIYRDQPLYIDLARRDVLTNEANDFVEELLANQETYPAYLPILDKHDSKLRGQPAAPPSEHMLTNDVDGRLEIALREHLAYLHAPGSRTIPKKHSVIMPANLSDPIDAEHVYQLIKATAEDSQRDLRVGIIPLVLSTHGVEEQTQVGKLATAILLAAGSSDTEAHLHIVNEALQCVVKRKSHEAMQSKLEWIFDKMTTNKEIESDDPVVTKIKSLIDAKDSSAWLTTAQRDALRTLNSLLHSRFPGAHVTEQPSHLFLNGLRVDLPSSPITGEDVTTLTTYDTKYRSQPVAKALINRNAKLTEQEADEISFTIVKTCGAVDRYLEEKRTSKPEMNREAQNIVTLAGDPALAVTAYVDPLSEAAQLMSSILSMLHRQLNASVELVLLPEANYEALPLQRFYRYLFEPKRSFADAKIHFRKLPLQPILTMKMETPEAWNVQVQRANDDLDNLRVDPNVPSDIRSTKSAVFQLESLLVYGQCFDTTHDQFSPPNGLQLVLDRTLGPLTFHRDTLVMKNLGYFQLQATPGVWSLHLARGRAADLFEFIDRKTGEKIETLPVSVQDFGSHIAQLMVRKQEGKEMEQLLAPTSPGTDSKADVEPIATDAGAFNSYWNSMLSFMGKKEPEKPTENAVAPAENQSGRTGETIHVFSVASGFLYERFIKIMMSSVLKRTSNPVTFWLLENFLSPSFKNAIPALREEFGMDIRLVTYKWPNWLRAQTEKQRIIWGYKILFLDVLFPLGVQKVIYVDADQVVRADLKELWDMDLHGAPYAYTPFCDSRNVGFQFWRAGYWKDHLRGKPYHISALYVVDLAVFRQMAAGDMLRAVYSQLSADPNSLANLDQDLPNYTQHQIPIFSLPQEWLWCESWCSDETKATAKTIDLCNNPKHKEPKLDMAKRVIAGELFNESWLELDAEIREVEERHLAETPSN